MAIKQEQFDLDDSLFYSFCFETLSFSFVSFFFFFLTQNSGERGDMALPCPGRPSASGVTGPVLGKHI